MDSLLKASIPLLICMYHHSQKQTKSKVRRVKKVDLRHQLNDNLQTHLPHMRKDFYYPL